MQIKSVITAIMISIASYSVAQSTKQEPQVINSEVSKLSAEVVDIKKDIASSKNNYEDKFKVVEMASLGISNQISTASVVLGVFSVLFTIFGLFIGAFIVHIQRKTELAEEKAELARKAAEEVLEKVNLAKASVDKTYELIESNISELYRRIKQEETDYIIKRLKKEPKDICNFYSALTTRELSANNFEDLKCCFLSLVSGEDSSVDNVDSGSFILLLVQHFTGVSMLDERLYPEINKRYKAIFEAMFKHEVEVSIADFIGLLSRDINGNKNKIIEFIGELKRCRPDIKVEIEQYISSAIFNNPLKVELEELFASSIG